MSRISSTFGKNLGLKSSLKSPGASHPEVSSSLSLKKGSSRNNSLLRSSGNLASSFSGTMSGKLNTSSTLERIESEYIKNLQQQVYFLELEANYLREQAKKATDMHPAMTEEAERMLNKLRQMQAEVDALNMENKRKESSLDMSNTEKERLHIRLKSEDDSHQREKRLLVDEMVQLKKEKELVDRDNIRKDSQILQAREEMDKSAAALRSAETKLQILTNQLDQKSDQHKLTQAALEEKRTELLQTETQLRELEDKYYSSTATLQDKLAVDLRDEIRMLRQKLKETEMAADQDRYLRSKLSDDSAHLVKENALLNQQVIELQKQLEREKSLRETQDNRRTQSITEFVVLKDREKQLHFDLNQVREELKHEKNRVQHYMEQLAKLEHVSTSQGLNASTTRSKLAEFEAVHQKTETENSQLRRDKMLLVDHVADLQRQIDEKETEIVNLRSKCHSYESRVNDLDHLKTLEASIQSQKWEEFSRLADSMKSLSNTMAKTATSNLDFA